MAQLANASATSLNFIGFEELTGQGLPKLIYNQVFIEPNQSYTAGKGAIAAAGYVPGTQSYLKRKQALWTQSQVGRAIANEGFEFGGSESIPLTNKQADSKYLSEQGHGAPTDAAWGTVMPPAMIQGDESGYTHPDPYIMRGFIPPS